ncbi:MAG: methylated-DNA--[protein]-cysteine S-methyltransferase [Kofleriaceae bacterium]
MNQPKLSSTRAAPAARRAAPAARRAAAAPAAPESAASVAERYLPSPLGELRLIADDDALLGVYFPRRGQPSHEPTTPKRHALLDQAARELTEYFAGQRRRFEVPLRPVGTEFQRQVWLKLREIPFGETWSYGELATAIGNRNASRAVGAANGQNPHSIIVPCHRVIGADGSLTGFGGGEPAKRWLLDHEAKVAGRRLF